jgi:methanogenic corrinoid protein MtbC1
MDDFKPLYQAIVLGSAKAAREAVRGALASGAHPAVLLDECMIPAMDEVGRRFEADEYGVPEMLISARAMKGALDLLKPLIALQSKRPVGKVAIGTVLGDIHDIGKNLVAAMLVGGGFEVIDLGSDVAPDRFVDAVKNHGANIVAMSAMMRSSMPGLKTTIDALADAGLRGEVKVMVGGGLVTKSYAEEIGADGFGDNATRAVRMARILMAG